MEPSSNEFPSVHSASDVSGSQIGKGIPVGVASAVTGKLIRVDSPDEVLALLDSGDQEHILLVSAASATGIAPILPDAKAVVCTSGGPTSHLALVCKEFGIPCVMSVSFTDEPDGAEPASVRLDIHGGLFLE